MPTATFKSRLAHKSVDPLQRLVVENATQWMQLAKLWLEQENLPHTAADVIALARLYWEEHNDICRECREDEERERCAFCEDEDVPDGVRPS